MEQKKNIKISLKTAIIISIGIALMIIVLSVIFINQIKHKNMNNNVGIKIRYADKYNITTAEILNEMAEEQGETVSAEILEINITDTEELKRINNLLKDWEYKDYSSIYKLIVFDKYEVTLEDGTILYIGSEEEFAQYNKGEISYLTKVPKEFTEIIKETVKSESSK